MTVEPITKAKPAKPANDACPHVVRAMNAVTAALAGEGISKSRANSQQGYKFRGIDEVLNALSRIIADNKLVIIPHVQSRELTERQTKSGGALFSVTVRVDYTFISAEDGSREVVGPFDGEAMDSADKATNKAMSAAYKYMAIQTFCIPTEGDNDADATTHEVVPGAAGGAAHPPSLPRQQPTKVLNPETGRMVDPNSAHQQRKNGSYPQFEAKVRAFTDLDELESWWASGATQAAIDQWPADWQKNAAAEYEACQEKLANAGRP